MCHMSLAVLSLHIFTKCQCSLSFLPDSWFCVKVAGLILSAYSNGG